MEKFESRLQGFISTQLDGVKKKVNMLVELAMVDRFHVVASTFDGVTSSTAYVPKVEPKGGLENEAGFMM